MMRHLLLSLAGPFVLTACGQSGPSPVPSAVQQMRQIVQNSGGNWDKLSKADQDKLIAQSHGNLMSAKMSFSMQWRSEQAMKGAKTQPGAH